MRYVLIVLAAAALARGAASAASAADAKPTWKAGLATLKITPQKPLWLAGYGGRKGPSEGMIHDLWVKVLALEDAEGHRAVLITSDVCGHSKIAVAAIGRELERQCGLGPAQVMLNASHTHSGPVLREALSDYYPMSDAQWKDVEEYSLWLEKQIVATVAKALKDLAPATLHAGQGRATFAVNRRNNREAEIPELMRKGVELKGPVDHTVPVLAVRDPAGRLRAVAFGYACPTTTLSTYVWCGDYAGFAQIAVQERHPGAVALFWAGCGADQNPLPRRSVELCAKYGTMLADGVEEALGRPMRAIEPRLRTAFARVDLAFERHPTKDELEADLKRPGIRGRWAQRMLDRLARGEAFAQSYPFPIHVWKLGADQWWIGLGGETVVDYSLKLKSLYGGQTWVTGYTQELVAYMPSRRVWDEGGYEGKALYEYMLPADRWESDVEDRILAGVEKLVASLR